MVSSEWLGIERKNLEDRVRRYRSAFEEVSLQSHLKRHDKKLSKGLYDLLLRKTFWQVKKGEKIILAPGCILGLLPFEALVMEENPVSQVRGRCL